MSDLIVYIDGFNLYHGMKQAFRRRYLWLDVVDLSRALRPRSRLVQVRYFTASVLDDAAAASRQGRYQQAMLARHPGVLSITQGRYQRKTMQCRSCSGSWTYYEEKETDVNIATAIVSDVAAGRADSILVVSADSDLVPAVKAAQELRPEIFIAAAFPPKRSSSELKRLMPASFHINRAKIAAAQMPDQVSDANSGRTYSRPGKWA